MTSKQNKQLKTQIKKLKQRSKKLDAKLVELIGKLQEDCIHVFRKEHYELGNNKTIYFYVCPRCDCTRWDNPSDGFF